MAFLCLFHSIKTSQGKKERKKCEKLQKKAKRIKAYNKNLFFVIKFIFEISRTREATSVLLDVNKLFATSTREKN